MEEGMGGGVACMPDDWTAGADAPGWQSEKHTILSGMENLNVWSAGAALTLVSLAALHAVWATGNPWPARNAAQLSAHVIGGHSARDLPPPVACLTVAAALLTASALALAAPGAPGGSLVNTGAQVVAGTLLLRGTAGYALPALLPAMRGTPFVPLNAWLYSPLCLLLGAAILLSLR